MIDKLYVAISFVVVALCLAFYFAGYKDAKSRYQCHQVGGTSSIYKGEVATYKVCK